ncbi:androgen-induced gene 1 protein-like [Panonychus citri]|uniref:androgen-induced gene 1 protein-like n=1 Tax=Panonychus citri TaxID=50023 RepID=UPI0023070140|nr:androgen-induced gene 1 protein-like [Panonychus citri]
MSKKMNMIPSYRYNNGIFVYGVKLFRLISFVMYGFAIGWINTHPSVPPYESVGAFGGSLKFLTYWNLLTQFILFTLINYCDFFLLSSDGTFKHNQSSSVLIKLRDIVHHGLALPLGLFVVLVYWMIFAIDPELIYPIASRPYYPEWLNQITHSAIGITVLVEEFAFYHPRDDRKAFIALLTYIVSYFIWVLYLGYVINYWPYSVIRIIPDPYKIPFIVTFGPVFGFILNFTQFLHNKQWPTPYQRPRKEKRR